MTARFVVQGRPVPKARPRIGRGGIVFTPSKTIAAERLVQAEWMAAGRPTVGGQPVCVTLRFEFARPKSHMLKNGSLSAVGERAGEPGGDTDNLTKLVLDGLNGLAWADDRQVVSIDASKGWGRRDRTIVEFHAVDRAVA